MTRFYSVPRLLYKYSPAVLASAIEQGRIYFKNDTLGSIKEAEDDCDGWQCKIDPISMQKIIYCTGNENTASTRTKSRALALLEIYSTYRGMEDPYQQPMEQIYRRELENFGWTSAELPNFDAIKQEKVALGSPPKKITNQSPPTGIIPINEPRTKDDWFLIMEAAIHEYEKIHGHTPSRNQLRSALIETSPKDWDVKYQMQEKQFTSSDIEKPLSNTSFTRRYRRYYPQK